MAISGIYDQAINSLQAQRKAQEDYLKQLQENQAKQLQSQVNQTIGQLESSKKGYEQTYNDNARQAYVQKMKAQRDLPQQLAAQGISGGLSESGNIALNTSYGNQLGEYKRNYDNQLDSVNQNIYNAQQDYNAKLAELNNTYLANLAESNRYYDQQITAQQLAKAQAEEQVRQAQIAAQQQAAQQAAARQKAAENQRQSQLKNYLNEAKNRKTQSTNAAINYLANQATWGNISQAEYKDLLNQLNITEAQEREYFSPISSNGTRDYYYYSTGKR